MKVREAAEADLPAIVEIYNASIRGGDVSTNTRPATVTGSRGWFRQHKAAGRPILVAEDAGEVVGWLSVRPFFRRPAYDATAKVLVYVAPEARRKGIGKALLNSLIAGGQPAGVNTLVCYLLSGNEPARRLFEGSGFQKWGHFPAVASIGGVERDLVVMGRRI